MARDVTYTNGVIAAGEKYLLKDKIFKMCETGAEEALRILSEVGFGKGAETDSVYGYENLVSADEKAIDSFIREYAPCRAEEVYLLAPRDFHNAKAVVKAVYLNLGLDKMTAPDGLIPVNEILSAVQSGEYGVLGKILGGAVEESARLLSEGSASGARIGIIFEKALYEYLLAECSKNATLKKLLTAKADMTNIITALRAGSPENAREYFVAGGKLTEEKLSKLFCEDKERALKAFVGTDYHGFVKLCFADTAEGLPLTSAERFAESYETEYFGKNRYALKSSQPFLYYVFRRRAENANVRIVFVCVLAGMKESQIKSRLRVF